MRYSITNIRLWKARKVHYFEIIDSETGSRKRISDKSIENLVVQKQGIDNEIKNGTYGLDFVSLEDVFGKYMESLLKREPSQSTINDYNYCAKQLWTIKIKNTFIRNMGVRDFTVPDINLINIYMNENFSVRSNKQCFNLLTRIFKFALNHNLGATMNPCREVDRSEFKSIKKKYDGNKKDPVVVQGGFDESLKKINGLLMKLKEWKFQHYVMVRLMCELGGRCGEVLPLMIDDYNYGSNTIDINKTVNTNLNTLTHQTKTSTGMRTVALSKTMGDLLTKHIDTLEDQRGLIFPSERNTIIQGNNFANRILNKFNKELGIVGRINPHSFRVFVITLRNYLEHKKKYMMEDSGHASKQISDHYVRGKWVNLDRKREDANQIADLLN
ncbi:MAG: putative integrase [Prokaryotic dsDNA virus sp.]|nr:MAG: putative integrase [Prokaryotic dsDNA virus sp.]|tara:strand:+ start:964 stop:2118 length:1155 start_codon:yes stop_codon:yes gene_type:complete